jgi:hypothetical protein
MVLRCWTRKQFAARRNGVSTECWLARTVFNNAVEIADLLSAEYGARLIRYMWWAGKMWGSRLRGIFQRTIHLGTDGRCSTQFRRAVTWDILLGTYKKCILLRARHGNWNSGNTMWLNYRASASSGNFGYSSLCRHVSSASSGNFGYSSLCRHVSSASSDNFGYSSLCHHVSSASSDNFGYSSLCRHVSSASSDNFGYSSLAPTCLRHPVTILATLLCSTTCLRHLVTILATLLCTTTCICLS